MTARSNPAPPSPAQGAVESGRGGPAIAAASGPQRLVIPEERESQFQTSVVRAAKTLGWATYHTHDSRRSNRGWPDLALCKPPRLILAELKTNRGRLTIDQAAWLDVLRLCPGIETYVWRPKDWRDLLRVLQALP